jgi:hypothetical protein
LLSTAPLRTVPPSIASSPCQIDDVNKRRPRGELLARWHGAARGIWLQPPAQAWHLYQDPPEDGRALRRAEWKRETADEAEGDA